MHRRASNCRAGLARERLSSAHTTGAVRVRRKRVVLTPGVCASRLAVVQRPDRARASVIGKTTGAIVHRSPGRARHKPSNHCAGKGRDVQAALYAAVHLSSRYLRTADRGCQPAPGLPCALSKEGRREKAQDSGVMRREAVEVCGGCVLSSVPCEDCPSPPTRFALWVSQGRATRSPKGEAWCPWPESNQHSLRNSILSRARLPVPPQGPPVGSLKGASRSRRTIAMDKAGSTRAKVMPDVLDSRGGRG